MPIYEYRCDACSETLESIQGIREEPLETCPACGEDRLRRLISATSFVLKGDGWYQSDYGRKAQTPPSSTSGESPSGDGGGGATESPSGDGGGGATESASTSSASSASSASDD